MRSQHLVKLLKDHPDRYIVKHKYVVRSKATVSKHIDGKRPKRGYPRSLRRARKAQKMARRAHRFG